MTSLDHYLKSTSHPIDEHIVGKQFIFIRIPHFREITKEAQALQEISLAGKSRNLQFVK